MLKNRVLRYWAYFRRGNSTYLVFLISFANFIVIQYRLLIQYVPFLEAIFSSLLVFALTFFLIYVPLATVIGWADYKKGAVPIETSLIAQTGPWYRDISRALILICEGKYDEAKKLLEKWAE